MLKQTMFSFVISLLTWSAVADDAMTLPKGVFRFYNIFTAGQIDGAYDDAGEEIKLGAALTATAQDNALSTALSLEPEVNPEITFLRYDFITEYGIRDNVSLQAWVPVYLSMKNKINPNDDFTTLNDHALVNGAFDDFFEEGTNAGTLGDMLVGVKWQFWKSGETTISQNAGDMRAAVAVGGYLPTGSLKELDQPTDIFTTTVKEYKAFIPGIRTYFDYQVTNWMFVNFFSEHQFRLKGDATRLVDSAQPDGDTEEGKFKPGMKNLIELDFTFHPTLAENLTMDSGFKAICMMTEKGEFSGFDVDALNSKTLFQREYRIEPYVGAFYRGWKIPVKGILSHSMPIEAKNVDKITTTSARIEAYLKF